MQQIRVSAARAVAVTFGLGILALAGYKLCVAVDHALATGTVLLEEATRIFPRAAWPYKVADAWAYFAGWLLFGAGGGALAISSSKRMWALLLVPFLLLGGSLLIAAAPMLGTVGGAALFLGVVATGFVGTVAFALWSSRRQERQHVKDVERSGEGERAA